MGKHTKKVNNYNEDVLDQLKASFGYSIDYIRKCIRGDRTGIMPDKIKAAYYAGEAAATAAAKKAITEKITNLNNQ